jgi:hypothetical protein
MAPYPINVQRLAVAKSVARSSSLPLGTAVNFALLLTGARRLVQFDLKWATDDERTAARRTLEEHANLVSSSSDTAGNVAVFLKEDRAAVLQEIEAAGGMRSVGYARLLDPDFYCCEHDLLCGERNVYSQQCLTHVVVNVIRSHAHVGPLYSQMLTADELAHNLGRLHQHYERVRRMVAAIDPELQTMLTIYSKPGDWEASPSYAVDTLKDS